MHIFAFHFLLIFTTGNFLSEVTGDCEGKTDVLGERTGSIQYSFPTSLHSNSHLYDETLKESTEKWSNVTCTWIINALKNQTVWIKVVSIDEDTSLQIKFSKGKVVKEEDKGTSFTGNGRTTVEWSWKNGTSSRAPKLYLSWNISDDGQVPYTDFDNNPISPSQDAPKRATHAPHILGLGSASPNWEILRDTSAQGGDVSAFYDKNGAPVPQEGSHNGQETTGATISDPANTMIRSWADIQTETIHSYAHAKTQTGPALTLSDDTVKWKWHTSARRDDVTTATSTYLNRGKDNAYTDNLLKKSLSIEVGNLQTAKIYPDIHNGTRSTPLISAVSVNSQTDSPLDSVVSKTVPGLNRFPESNISFTSSNDESISVVTPSLSYATDLAEKDRKSGSLRLTPPNQAISEQTPASVVDDSNTVPSVVTHNQNNLSTFSPQISTSHLEASESKFPGIMAANKEETPLAEHIHPPPDTTQSPNPQPTLLVHSQDSTSTNILTIIQSEHPTVVQQTSLTFLPSAANQPGSTDTLDHNTHHMSSPELPLSEPMEPSELPLRSQSPNTNSMRQSNKVDISTIFPFVITTPWVSPTVTPELMVQGKGITQEALHNRSEKESDTANMETYSESPTGTQSYSGKQQKTQPNTPHFSLIHFTETNIAISQSINVPQTDPSGNEINNANSSQSGVSLGPMISVSISPSISSQTGSMEVAQSLAWTERKEPVTSTTGPEISLSSAISTDGEAVSTKAPSLLGISQTPNVSDSSMTTQRNKITPTPISRLTPSHNTVVLQTHIPMGHPSTSTPAVKLNTNSLAQTSTHTLSTPALDQTSSLRSVTHKTDKNWSHKAGVFIVEDQPAIIKVETFQVLLQVILEETPPPHMELTEMEPFLHRVAGYQNQQLTWHSGPVLQTLVTFHTLDALSWLGRVESLLQEAGLSPLPLEGIFVGGVRVKNITVGGLHTDVCSWLFMCMSGFQCISSGGNASCRSLCHSEYCKNHGICVHHPGQKPLCQCPVGEDFWFMGQRCDLRMTRQRLVGVCFGVLLAVASLMAIVSYLAVRRFKSMLIQAKVDQTRSSYRRFNHFDELSARFWGRSWPGSEDSLDNPAFTRSDELLHLRALDRTCCYHDDTLSIASTYPDSVSQLNTVYPHSSHYRWDLSNYSLADCVVDSGKASDLSVCSWPIEPIQWTPFPLLQQLSRNTASVKASRTRSYCEGMELVDLEKSWTA